VTAPTVSVVIPCYNSRRFLEQTVDSVRAQRFAGWELLLVDDGSTDGTSELVERLADEPRIRALHQQNGGVARARNHGLRAAAPESRYVIFLDHDDVWEPDALELLVAALEAQPSAPAAFGLARYVTPNGDLVLPEFLEAIGRSRRALRLLRPADLPAGSDVTFEILVYSNVIHSAGQVLLRRLALAADPFAPELVPCDDLDLWLRLSPRGAFRAVDQVVLNWRTHSTNQSGDAARMAAGYLNVLYARLLRRELPWRRRLQLLAALPYNVVRMTRVARKYRNGRG
jgi:glycosyltransferase involved in cell wall biosynthesis